MRALCALLLVAASTASDEYRRPICRNATGTASGRFYMIWRDGGSGCLLLHGDGGYGARWQLGTRQNLVAGTGWARGRGDRIVRYRARAFEPGANGYLSLYGWSTTPLVEYYIVERWGGFIPPGPDATPIGTVTSDGGTYRVYRTRRIDQPSIAGTATFDQYWSVRTTPRPLGAPATITLANHVSVWRRLGLPLGTLRYQIVATEGFGSSGRSDIEVEDLPTARRR